MKRSTICCCALCGLLIPSVSRGALLYYVSASGTAHAEAGDPVAPNTDDHPYNTGQLPQASTGGSQSASANAIFTIGDFGEFTFGRANVNSSAQLGTLHAYAFSSSDTGLAPPPPVVLNSSGIAKGKASAASSWSDQFYLRSDNPNGSDFVWTLGLDDHIDSGGVFYPIEDGFFAAIASATLNFTQNNLGPIDGAVIGENHTVFSNGTIADGPAAEHVKTITFHALYNVSYFTTLTCNLSVTANSINGTGQCTADASDTALFALYCADPLASYTTASGTVYPTSVPEPASLALILPAAAVFILRQRSPRSGRSRWAR
jgi:hypothetical protein